MNETVRRLLDQQGCLHRSAMPLASDANLYDEGLTPFAAILVMLALEEHYEIDFPVSMLRRQSFSSIDAIVACLESLPIAKTLSSRVA